MSLIDATINDGDINLFYDVLWSGANPNEIDEFGMSPLLHCLYTDGTTYEMLNMLFKAGADPNLKHGEDGDSIMMYILDHPNSKLFKCVLDNKRTNIYQLNNNNENVMYQAVRMCDAYNIIENKESKKIVKLLIDYGFDINHINDKLNLKTVLLDAVINCSLSTICYLIKLGADLNINTLDDRTIYDISKESYDSDVRYFFIKYKAICLFIKYNKLPIDILKKI